MSETAKIAALCRAMDEALKLNALHMELMTGLKDRIETLEHRIDVMEVARNGTDSDKKKKSSCECLAVPVP